MERENITILSVGLRGLLGLKVKYIQGKHYPSERNCTESAPVHEDLLQAFEDLHVHLALISEMIPENEISNVEDPQHELLESFSVNGIDFKDKDTGVSITGRRKLSTGKNLSLTTPTVKWDDKNKKAYTHASQLAEIAERIKNETIEYLFNGKRAPDPEGDLFEGIDEADAEPILSDDEDVDNFADQIGDDE